MQKVSECVFADWVYEWLARHTKQTHATAKNLRRQLSITTN